ncbi:LOW QUALITY PROTEIN: protocadherin Fat 4-like [Saccoglossus kowalevskii]
MPLGCSDGDLGDTLTYSLLVGDSSVFSVSTGDLILTSSLDYDSGLARQYDLEITVVDSAGQSHVIEGTVHVKHVNEDAPAFQPTSLYSVDFEENQTPDTLVITVVATDTDSDDTEDGVVTYSFAASCTVDCAMFSIDPASGEISNSQELDRELNDAYTLVIEAADDAFTATATVEVTIIDVNDNTPIFANDIIEKDIEEGQGAITLVEYITAVDSDDPGTDDNGVVTYSIVDGNADGHFSINSFTGDLKTAQSLDYEEVTSYELKIVGTDRNGGVGSLSSTVTVRVNVLPKNEFSPSFSENPVERDVLEDVDIGDFLFLVNADDNDDGDDGDVTYQMNIHPKFRLDPSTGELFLKDKLDRESTSSYTLTLNAVDGGSPAKSGATTVIITVTDANDNTPVCSPSHISVTFPEDTASIIASLSCTDDDDGPDNNRLTYTIVSEDGVVGSGTIFSLSGDDVVLATGLDYETATEHTLKIRVEDNGLSPLSATVSITVEVTGVNEYDPVIAALTPITMLENAPVDLSVIKDIDATDADLGEYVTYEIIPDDPRFYCDPLTGEISLLSEIDADPGPLTISLTVRATDDGLVHALRYSEATLTINVDDVNDNNPVFLDHSYYFICSENSGIGDSIGTVSATDVDSGVNGDIKYTISPNDGVFTVGLTSGVINVGAALDLETTSSYTYTVIATDQGTGSLTGSSSVTIEITGYNDESPVLSAAGPVDIREDAGWGDSVITVAATDGDAGVDGMLGYIITGGSDGKFNIDYNTGLISVAGILDYETTTAYTLTVEATDHGIDPGALTDDITVVINVLPINDNKPTCNPVLYAVPVQDSAVANDPVLTPVCEDLDLPGDVLTYSMATSTYFDIDTSTGEITVKSDLAVAPSPVYSLFVEVIDDGTDPGALSSTFTVVIELQGDNKMAPDFDSNVYILTAMEDQAPGTVITTNTVYAEDTDVGSAGRVTYTIIDGNDSGTFRINGTTGELFIEKSLDRERQEIYYLNVSAEDDGSPSYITYVGVEVTVLDVNDEAPICDPLLYTASIVEEDPTILTIATVICNDSDKAPTDNSDFEFEIGAGNDGTAFSITPDTGEVKNVGALDLETQEFYQLIIHAVDKGTPSLTGTATVNVQVTGVNDNEPYFSPVTQGTIVNEANPLQVSFYQVVAYDDDQHQDGAVMFNITEGNDNNIFGINSATGELHLVNPLDRETLDTHTLTIEAIDLATDPALRLTGTGTVIVTVTDSNDEAPLCDPIEAYVSFTENAVPNDIITTLNCTDADLEPPNNDFTLSILSGNDDNKFYLFQNQIKVTDTLDYEEQQQYVLEIKLIDKGTPTQTGYTTLTINIIPVNEFAPVYEEDTYIFDIYEDVSLRTTVGSVKATDEDYNEDYHGIPRYYIKNGNDENKFAIDPETGEIFTIGLLNREVTATYDLLIMAQDSTALRNDQLDVNQTVTINVIDVNDNKPEFRPNAYFQVIMETLPPGSTILMVTATDADEGTNAEFTFEIESGNVDNTFYFDGDYLVVNKKVDLNVAVFYRLTVNVIDHGTYPGPLQNYGVITLLVDSTNEYNPTFDQEDDILLVSEGTKIGAHIYTAIADDFDVGCHGTLRYIVEDVVPASGVNHFYIDELYGEMLLSSYLDREEQSTYDVTITAIDDSCNDTTDIRTDSLVVHVVVTDENDNSPEFTESGYVFYVTENIPLETLIDRVRATDVDEGVNAQIEYTMDSLSYTDKFTVDLDGGGVTTSGELDFEEQRAYSFLVVARDKGTEPRSTIVTVIVNLLDENDNEPILYPDVMHVAIDENVEEGTLVTLIDAYDLDSTTNGEFIYEIIDGDINDAFVLDPLKGELYTSNNILDREYIDVYTLIIKTTDMGTPPMFYTGTVTVTVLDLNDNDPVANPVFYEETVSEDVSIGTQLLDIEATDSDILENGNLTYSFLTGNTASRFSIYETTGVIRVAKSLNRESVDEYTLYILIEDQGDPVRSATAVASIYVEDVNDSPPRFTPRNRAFSVLENSPAGVVLGNMYAEDQDLGTNAEFEFALIAGSGFGKFSVNSINGAVTLLVSNLDREARSSYQLIVRAQDNGSPPLFTDSTVTIAVTDINDHTPTFDRAFYDAEVIENAVPGTSVLIVHAVDKDTGNNAALTYSIDSTNVEANTYFQIDSDTGIIRVRDGIDYETYKEIIFDVNVEDGGDVPLADVTRVTISVVDENDNEPIISPCFINNEISYLHATSKGILATYAASDADASQQVTFELSPSSYVFQIGSNTGTITAIPGVEPADDAKYVLQLLARDDGYPQQTSDPCLARIDTFNPYIYMLDLHMSSTTQSEFEGKKVQLLSSLNSLLRGRVSSARVGISHLSGGGASTASRRLLAADDLVIHVYAVENSEADNVYGIENEKVFLTNEYLHSIFAADIFDNPVGTLKENDIFKVQKYPGEDWYRTPEGIAGLTMGILGLIALFTLPCLCYCCCKAGLCDGCCTGLGDRCRSCRERRPKKPKAYSEKKPAAKKGAWDKKSDKSGDGNGNDKSKDKKGTQPNVLGTSASKTGQGGTRPSGGGTKPGSDGPKPGAGGTKPGGGGATKPSPAAAVGGGNPNANPNIGVLGYPGLSVGPNKFVKLRNRPL